MSNAIITLDSIGKRSRFIPIKSNDDCPPVYERDLRRGTLTVGKLRAYGELIVITPRPDLIGRVREYDDSPVVHIQLGDDPWASKKMGLYVVRDPE